MHIGVRTGDSGGEGWGGLKYWLCSEGGGGGLESLKIVSPVA